jgi:hypothetical protein
MKKILILQGVFIAVKLSGLIEMNWFETFLPIIISSVGGVLTIGLLYYIENFYLKKKK